MPKDRSEAEKGLGSPSGGHFGSKKHSPPRVHAGGVVGGWWVAGGLVAGWLGGWLAGWLLVAAGWLGKEHWFRPT